jgi:bifunctional non-homologous end joining protein LigD
MGFISDAPKPACILRNGSPQNQSIVSALETLKHRAILDGEIVVVDADGRANFDLLQDYRLGQKGGTLVYFVFDLLYLDGRDLRLLPLGQRKELLQATVPSLPCVRYCEHVENDGVAFFGAYFSFPGG